MSKNILLFVLLGVGLGLFWWLGQQIQTQVVPFSGIFGDDLQVAGSSRIVELEDGESFDMEMSYVSHEISGRQQSMLAYNGTIPGPTIKVPQNSTITLNVINNTDEDTLLHPHGLRLDNEFDGTHLTQDNIKPGETFSYTLNFPDPGMYWYHPHFREDKTQPMGLYGNFWVVPEDEDYWSPVNQEIPLTLSDILLDENGNIYPFEDVANHTLMGRYGNTMLVNGREDYSLEVKKGEVVRFYLTNVASVRPFNFSIPDISLKLVGGDSGAFERETHIDKITISPSERYIIEAYFEEEGVYQIKHLGPDKQYQLGEVVVGEERVETSYTEQFSELRVNEKIMDEMDEFRTFMDKESDKVLILDVDMSGMNMMDHDHEHMSGMHQDHDHGGMAHMHRGGGTGIEWEDDMPMMNKVSNTENVTWQLIDEETGNINENIHWEYEVGDRVKISIFNNDRSAHPMQHPIHFHGQRFLILKHNREMNDNLVWKDTVFVPAGDMVEILLDMTNPGKWMAHCHIPEHLEAGMMLRFDVI